MFTQQPRAGKASGKERAASALLLLASFSSYMRPKLKWPTCFFDLKAKVWSHFKHFWEKKYILPARAVIICMSFKVGR